MINFDGILTDVVLDEFAGMAARRIAIARGREQGLTWSESRKASLNAVADEKLKEMIRVRIIQGEHPKDAIHNIVNLLTKRKM